MLSDAMKASAIKKMEGIKPKIRHGRRSIFDEHVCGSCGRTIAVNDNYCSGCGYRILWDSIRCLTGMDEGEEQ